MKLVTLLRMVLLTAVVLLLGAALMSQTAETGAITGTVQDPTGAVVPNAKVTLTNLATGQKKAVTSGANGLYRFPLLPPGSYSLVVEAQGFKKLSVSSVTFAITETVNLTNVLTVGGSEQEVTVSAEAEGIQTTSSTRGSLIDEATISEMPLSTRNYTNLLGMAAGASTSVNNATALGNGNQQIAVNGADQYSNNFQMDGTSINNFSSNTSQETGAYGAFGVPNPDTIQEFKIQTSSYDAGYGRNAGGNVNVVTKGGSNQFHGTLFEFFRNTALDANDFFWKHSELSQGEPNKQQVLNQNQFGFTFGGPVIKDKLFFFTSFQETRQKNGAAGYGYTTPTLPVLPNGDRSQAAFQNALGAAYCNSPSFAEEIGAYLQFPGAPTPARVACDGSNINAVAMKILNLKLTNGSYYVPGGTSMTTPTPFSIPAIFKEHQGMGNWDYAITQKELLTGRYFFSTKPTQAPFPGSGLGFPAPNVPGNPISEEYGNQTATLKLVSTLHANMVNELRLGYQRATVIAQNEIPFKDSDVGMTPVQPTANLLSNIWILPIGGPTQMDLGAHPFFGNNSFVDEYQLAEQISWSHGRHQFRFGASGEKDQWNWDFKSLSTGVMIFPTFQDFLLGLPQGFGPGTTNTFLANIVSEPNFTTRSQGASLLHHYRQNVASAFAQDDWKLTNRLTVNLGVRWEYTGQFYEENGLASNLVLSTIAANPTPTTAPGTLLGWGVAGNYKGAVPADVSRYSTNGTYNALPKDHFAPRLGFSWQPTSSAKFVTHGGFGMFYDMPSNGDLINGLSQSQPSAYTLGFFPSSASLANPWDPTPAGWQSFRYQSTTAVNGSYPGSGISQAEIMDIKNPVMYVWNLNVQYEFLPKWILETGYSGSHAIHTHFNNDYPFNYAPLNGNGVTTNTAATAVLRAPYLGISPQDTGVTNKGATKFNALELTLRKQFSHGLQMEANYTWSKTLNLGSTESSQVGATAPDVLHFNPNNAKHFAYDESGYYHPSRLALNFHYEFPFKEKGNMVHKVFGGWSAMGVWIWQDGDPLTITDAGGGSVYFGGTGNTNFLVPGQLMPGKRPKDALAHGSMSSKALHGYFNPTALCTTSAALNAANGNAGCVYPNTGNSSDTEYGNFPYSSVLGPGQNNVDFTIARAAKVGGIREDGEVQFRAEFFNLFNHAQFSIPNTVDSGGALGQITSTSVNPRLVQFALKYQF